MSLKALLVAHLARELAQAALDARVTETDCLWIVQAALVVEAVKKTRGNKCKAARLLDIHRNSFDRWVKDFKLEHIVKAVKEVSGKQIEMFPRKKSSTGVHSLAEISSEISASF